MTWTREGSRVKGDKNFQYFFCCSVYSAQFLDSRIKSRKSSHTQWTEFLKSEELWPLHKGGDIQLNTVSTALLSLHVLFINICRWDEYVSEDNGRKFELWRNHYSKSPCGRWCYLGGGFRKSLSKPSETNKISFTCNPSLPLKRTKVRTF